MTIFLIILYLFNLIVKIFVNTFIIDITEENIGFLQSLVFLLILFFFTKIVYVTLEKYIYKKNFQLIRIKLYAITIFIVMFLVDLIYLNLHIKTLVYLLIFNLLWAYIPNAIIKKFSSSTSE